MKTPHEAAVALAEAMFAERVAQSRAFWAGVDAAWKPLDSPEQARLAQTRAEVDACSVRVGESFTAYLRATHQCWRRAAGRDCDCVVCVPPSGLCDCAVCMTGGRCGF